MQKNLFLVAVALALVGMVGCAARPISTRKVYTMIPDGEGKLVPFLTLEEGGPPATSKSQSLIDNHWSQNGNTRDGHVFNMRGGDASLAGTGAFRSMTISLPEGFNATLYGGDDVSASGIGFTYNPETKEFRLEVASFGGLISPVEELVTNQLMLMSQAFVALSADEKEAIVEVVKARLEAGEAMVGILADVATTLATSGVSGVLNTVGGGNVEDPE